jgi:predicted Zn-dependent peptidase
MFYQMVDRRLFNIVREEKQLTYDASFQLHPRSILPGSWFTVSVTSSPQQVAEAIEACRGALATMKRAASGVNSNSLQAAKRTLLNKFYSESTSNHFWVDMMSGTQMSELPLKTLRGVAEYEKVVSSVTLQDMEQLVEMLKLDDGGMVSCVGIASSTSPMKT